MQPIARFAPRRIFASISALSPPLSRPLRSAQLARQNSICLQCRSHFQTRKFTNDSKPTSSTPLDGEEKATSPPKTEAQSEAGSTLSRNSAAVQDGQAEELPSSEESRRMALTKKFSHIMDNLQGNIFVASQKINDLTGYSGIEALKARIVRLEQKVQDAQEEVRNARQKYKSTVAERAATQREVTALLARKDTWTPIDLERFTSLYRSDHTNEQAVQESATRLGDAEREAEHAATTLSSSILARYHEEQIWSDKIRRMSTWGTWGLMGMNVLLFLVFQLGFEPWRRKRLVHGFEEKVIEALELEKARQASVPIVSEPAEVPAESLVTTAAEPVEEVIPAVEEEVVPLDPVVVEAEAIPLEVEQADQPKAGNDIAALLTRLRIPKAWKIAAQDLFLRAQDLFSEQTISMRKHDITVIALEGAAAGAVVAGVLATAILRRS